MNKLNGLIYGILSSASFGLIPLFAIPAMQHGMDFMNVLSYRFLFATLSLAILLKVRRCSFRIEKKDFSTLLLLAIFYLISSVFLLWGYNFMPSGIATTLHFMYPVITTLVMMAFFHEKSSKWRISAIILAIAGVYALSHTEPNGKASLLGIVIVLLSAVGYALYLVCRRPTEKQKYPRTETDFLRFPVRNSHTLGRNESFRKSSGNSRPFDRSQPADAGHYSDRRFQPDFSRSHQVHRCHSNFRFRRHGTGNCGNRRHHGIRRIFFPDDCSRHPAHYFSSHHHYIKKNNACNIMQA